MFVFQVTFSKDFGSIGRKKSFSVKKVYATDFILHGLNDTFQSNMMSLHDSLV